MESWVFQLIRPDWIHQKCNGLGDGELSFSKLIRPNGLSDGELSFSKLIRLDGLGDGELSFSKLIRPDWIH